MIDPENPVIRLCTAGMAAEGQGRFEEARALFMQAWEARQDDYEAAIAAHYVARHQDSVEAMADWDQRALTHALAVNDEWVHGFMASLYLNMGKDYEAMGDTEKARHQYERAAEWLWAVPEGPYREMVADGVARGQERTSSG